MPLFPALLALSLIAPATAPVVCIDPGHVSEVGRGTRGRKLTELAVAWQTAVSLKRELEGDGYTVVLTKKREGEFVKNRRRAEIANAANADLMVRLHCDATGGSGFAVYYPSKPGKDADGKVGPSKEVVAKSRERAKRFHRAMAGVLKGKHRDNGLRTDLATAVGARQGALTGSIHSQVPVLLVEMVVLTNPRDEAFIASPAGRKAMAHALAEGVREAVQGQGSAGFSLHGSAGFILPATLPTGWRL
ncbi:MAG TPA: N-acetylmuramoyl-L-alanine amidase [Fimbriimonas sp.]